jgi:catalase
MMDWNFMTTDLLESINMGDYPSWDLYIQIIPPSDRYSYDFDILDTTHQWPEDQIPMQKIGTFTLDENFQNYFLEAEQIAFSPGHLVPGISPSDEKMLQARIFSYSDAQRYRMGINYHLIPINAPRCPFQQVQQDGHMNVLPTQNPINYWPSMNSNLTEAPLFPNVNEDPSNMQDWQEQGFKERSVIPLVDDFSQPSWRYSTWDADRQMRFAQRIASTLTTPGVSTPLANIWIERWTNVSATLGANIQSLVTSFSQSVPQDMLLPPVSDPGHPDYKLFENFEQIRAGFLRASGAK